VSDDVRECAPEVLRHRVVLRAESEIEGTKADDVVRELVGAVSVPK
jgi:MoxR-like ATPase